MDVLFSVTYRITQKGDNSESWTIDKRKHLQPHREAINCVIQVNGKCEFTLTLDISVFYTHLDSGCLKLVSCFDQKLRPDTVTQF